MPFDNSAIEKRVREEYKHLTSTYFNSAYFGPSPLSASSRVLEALERELDPSFFDHTNWLSISERIRAGMAQLLDVSPECLTHSTSTSDVISLVSNGYPLEKGDVVCSLDLEYPSNVLPWMRAAETRGIDFRLLDLGDDLLPTVAWLDEHLPDKTKIFTVSYVAFDTGKKIDLLSLGQYLRERGVFFVVDATQAFGGMPLTSQEIEVIDVISISSYKWLLGPYGHAFGYFSKRAWETIEHRGGNWLVTPKFYDMGRLLNYTTETLSGARKYDRGQTPNMLAMSCLGAAIEFLQEVGLENIQKHNAQIRDNFLENYPKEKYTLITPVSHMGNIICLKSQGVDVLELAEKLQKRHIDISIRQGNIRLSFHVFNTLDQVGALLEALG